MSSTKQTSLADSSTFQYEDSIDFAIALDAEDPLRQYRKDFLIPAAGDRKECIYLAGNSLGLQPRKARTYIEQELDDWANLGVEGHFEAKHPWLPYHENLTEMSARLVGAKPSEVVVMNTLTVNLHLMMVSFYRPTKERFKIVTEFGAFPSDQYAVASQAKFHGYNPEEAIIELTPRHGESILRTDDIIAVIEKEGDKVALIMLGDVNYLTGQAFEVEKIVKAARAKGCNIGLNLAHGAGNLLLKLHDWDVDFAVWCSYKYLNAGPGGLSGCFVHEKHANNFDLPRFAGWWGHNKKDRFKMGPKFEPIPGAEGWQLSNPPIFQLAALRASLEIFDAATMSAIREKSVRITGYLEYLLNQLPEGFCSIITPKNPEERGSQLSIRLAKDPKDMLEALKREGAICDFRNPDIIRATPIPLYVRYQDVFDFAKILARFAS
ncbi:MAG: kynureninase [Candidatus Melainabacteria bacterium]|nr:kynureninase [Candidatus Melainabacteria bacterium]